MDEHSPGDTANSCADTSTPNASVAGEDLHRASASTELNTLGVLSLPTRLAGAGTSDGSTTEFKGRSAPDQAFDHTMVQFQSLPAVCTPYEAFPSSSGFLPSNDSHAHTGDQSFHSPILHQSLPHNDISSLQNTFTGGMYQQSAHTDSAYVGSVSTGQGLHGREGSSNCSGLSFATSSICGEAAYYKRAYEEAQMRETQWQLERQWLTTQLQCQGQHLSQLWGPMQSQPPMQLEPPMQCEPPMLPRPFAGPLKQALPLVSLTEDYQFCVPLLPGFQKQEGSWYVPGKIIFAQDPQPYKPIDSATLTISVAPYYYVIMEWRLTFAIAYAIHTYRLKGVEKLNSEDHCIIHDSREAPLPQPNERRMQQWPLVAETRDGKRPGWLRTMSRVDFSRPIRLDFHTAACTNYTAARGNPDDLFLTKESFILLQQYISQSNDRWEKHSRNSLCSRQAGALNNSSRGQATSNGGRGRARGRGNARWSDKAGVTKPGEVSVE